MIPIYKPMLDDDLLSYAHDALCDGFISSAKGKYLELAENLLREMTGMQHVLLVNSGTSANHLMARCLSYRGYETIAVPSNSFIAAWNPFLYDDAFELFPYDANIETWNADYSDLGEEEVVLVVPTLGNIMNVPKLQLQYPDKIFVEDNCEGIFGEYGIHGGHLTGTKSLMSTLSFFGNKTVTSGEGGALLTNDTECFELAKKLRGQGQSEKRYIHDILGYNYRMTNVQAAILYGQLLNHDEILERKKNIFDAYCSRIALMDGKAISQIWEEDTTHSRWMYGVRVPGGRYEDMEPHFNDRGIDVRPMFYPMSSHDHLSSIARSNEEVYSTILSRECVILPSYPELTPIEVGKICRALEEYVGGIS